MYTVRLLTDDDANAFWEFRLSGLNECPQAFAESADELRSSPVEDTAQRLRSSSGDNFVGAFDEHRLIGTAGFFRYTGERTRHKGRVWGVYVDPGFRRQGIARFMMVAVLTNIRAVTDLQQVSLTVATTQVGAIALYEAMGFRVFGLKRRALRVGTGYVDEEYRALMLDIDVVDGPLTNR